MAAPSIEDALGPVQVVVVGTNDPAAALRVEDALERISASDSVRVLDRLRIRIGEDDSIVELGGTRGTIWRGGLLRALLATESARGERQLSADVWFLADPIPRGTAVTLVAIEHLWALPFREVVSEWSDGVFGDAWIHPRDLAQARRAAEQDTT